MQVSIRNQYDTGCANTGSHTLIINDNTPLSLTHSSRRVMPEDEAIEYQMYTGIHGEVYRVSWAVNPLQNARYHGLVDIERSQWRV